MEKERADISRLLGSMDKRLARIERKLSIMSNLLADASQKLCHLIKRQREQAQGYVED